MWLRLEWKRSVRSNSLRTHKKMNVKNEKIMNFWINRNYSFKNTYNHVTPVSTYYINIQTIYQQLSRIGFFQCMCGYRWPPRSSKSSCCHQFSGWLQWNSSWSGPLKIEQIAHIMAPMSWILERTVCVWCVRALRWQDHSINNNSTNETSRGETITISSWSQMWVARSGFPLFTPQCW